MGMMSGVRCPVCGYSEPALLGVGGAVGFNRESIATVACPTARCLLDVPAGAYPDPMEPQQCPKCGDSHELWDAEAAPCPRCGERCVIEMVGRWD